MSNFFEKSDLSRNEADNIISDTLNKCDDGELYLENSKSETILLDDNKIKNSSYNSDLGFGFRAVSGDVVAYSHSNEISKNSLKQSSDSLKSTLKSVKGTYNHSIPKSNKIDSDLEFSKYSSPSSHFLRVSEIILSASFRDKSDFSKKLVIMQILRLFQIFFN